MVQVIFKNIIQKLKKLKTFLDKLFLKIIFSFDFVKSRNCKFNLYNVN